MHLHGVCACTGAQGGGREGEGGGGEGEGGGGLGKGGGGLGDRGRSRRYRGAGEGEGGGGEGEGGGSEEGETMEPFPSFFVLTPCLFCNACNCYRIVNVQKHGTPPSDIITRVHVEARLCLCGATRSLINVREEDDRRR